MNQNNNQNKFPRSLTEKEKEWLNFILPAERKGYAEYRNKIEQLCVIGYGRFGGTNLILGKENDKPDLNAPSAPVFASGNIIYNEAEIYVLIHEEFENQIEIDISYNHESGVPEKLIEVSRWTYSNWTPGNKAPRDNSEIREIHLIKNEIVIAIAQVHKRIWVYENKSGINYFIPVTNFFNEIIRVREIREAKNLPKPDSIFTDTNSFSDKEIAQGFLLYNKHWKKLEIDNENFKKAESIKKKKSFFDFLKLRG